MMGSGMRERSGVPQESVASPGGANAFISAKDQLVRTCRICVVVCV
jgi:hypothetical protein